MELLKKFIRDRVCARGINWERTIGPVGILACDLSLSINLLRKLSKIEKNECRKCDVLNTSDIDSVRMPTYGITIEPFAVNLMGSDGDVCWSSPGWYLINWVFSKSVSEDDILPNSSTECSASERYATERYPSSEESTFGFNLGV